MPTRERAADRVLGRAEAVLEVVTDRTSNLDRLTSAVTALERRLSAIVGDVEALRTIVPDIEDVVGSLRSTRWMTTVELARHLRIHPNKVRVMYHDGIIPGYRFGDCGHLRFDSAEVGRALRDYDDHIERVSQ
jgi:excisionase family DNA binding protein